MVRAVESRDTIDSVEIPASYIVRAAEEAHVEAAQLPENYTQAQVDRAKWRAYYLYSTLMKVAKQMERKSPRLSRAQRDRYEVSI